MLTREEYVAVCETCVKRKFDSKQGIVCSLTNSHADFDTTCPSFEIDQLAAERIARVKQYAEQDSATSDPFALEKKMKSGSILGGILITAIGFIWLVAGLAFDWFFFYPVALIIAGFIMLVRGIAKKAKEAQKRDLSHVLDDPKGLNKNTDPL